MGASSTSLYDTQANYLIAYNWLIFNTLKIKYSTGHCLIKAILHQLTLFQRETSTRNTQPINF